MKVLLVIDMQNDFIDGALGSKEAMKIVPYVKEKVKEYKENGNQVIFTRDTHSTDYLSTQEGRNLPVEHCIWHTKGWEITPQLETEGCLIFDKPSFGSVELAQHLKEHCAKASFELVGLCTDICVISNAMLIKAYLPENEVTVDALGCAGVTMESHKNALEAMKMCQIKVLNEEGLRNLKKYVT